MAALIKEDQPAIQIDRTYADISAGQLDGLIQRYEKLAKRAVKLGLDQPMLEVTGTRYVAYQYDNDGRNGWKLQGKQILTDGQTAADLQGDGWVVKPRYDLQLTGCWPYIDGWQVVAKLNKLDDGQVMPWVAPDRQLPDQYMDGKMECDHCKLKRLRGETVILQKDGDYIQVGKTCLVDFTGYKNAEKVLDLLAELLGDAGRCGPPDREQRLFDLVEFLAMTSACIKRYRWVSKKKAESTGDTATVYRVVDEMTRTDDDDEFYDQVCPTPADWAAAYKAQQWATGLNPSGVGYELSIKKIAQQERIGWHELGFAASIIAGWLRATLPKTDDTPATATPHISQPLGCEGYPLEVVARLVTAHPTYGMYGQKTVLGFETIDGDLLTWFKTGYSDLVIDTTYRLVGKVTAHTEYKGQAQTVISYVKVAEVAA